MSLDTPGACDSHVHVFLPEQFAYDPQRSYTPGPANCGALNRHMGLLGLQRCVIVQPSVYGTDNACLLAGLKTMGPAARGVAVVDPATVTDAQLQDLQAAGVRALRVNFEAGGGSPADKPAAIAAMASRLRGTDLAIQLYVDIQTAATAVRLPAMQDVVLILDHYAGFKVGTDLASADFQSILDALRGGNIWVKLSAPYRTGCSSPDYSELQPVAEAMIEAAPQRMVWASDWPHTGGGKDRGGHNHPQIEPFRQIDSAVDLERLRSWVADPAGFAAIISDNPARLFDFS
ncbi:amidohydrolase family protein [Paracoccus sp. DMF-8]|uniref:amidohydrolase family protein n=1 Tax=Paracoccus sp. DMF-8 TaxID=3019445 RepID=UPI0023E8DE61|nr:amidohydrolase family protein [Paracoccus sp. DMF-8]MDF3606676.1 amidohydrolase family protein [Paracoccus sp. DMF-8]